MKKIILSITIMMIIGCANNNSEPTTGTPINQSIWGSVPDITINNNDKPYIAFYDGEHGDLILGYQDNNEWVTEIIDSEGDVGKEKGIIIDSNNTLHVVYQDRTNKQLKHAVKKEEEWLIEVIDKATNNSHVMDVDAAINEDDELHAVYNIQHDCDNNPGPCSTVKHAYQENNEWVIEVISYDGNFVQIGINNESIHASYNLEGNKIRYAQKKNEEWLVESINDSINAQRDNALIIDSNNQPHLAFHDTTNKLVIYATKKEGSWETKVIATNIWSIDEEPQGLKIGLDVNEQPVVIILNPAGGSLMMARQINDEWELINLDFTGYPSMIIDSDNNLHLARTQSGSEQRVISEEVVEHEDEGDFEYIMYHKIVLD